jgi:hypothetical protein
LVPPALAGVHRLVSRKSLGGGFGLRCEPRAGQVAFRARHFQGVTLQWLEVLLVVSRLGVGMLLTTLRWEALRVAGLAHRARSREALLSSLSPDRAGRERKAWARIAPCRAPQEPVAGQAMGAQQPRANSRSDLLAERARCWEVRIATEEQATPLPEAELLAVRAGGGLPPALPMVEKCPLARAPPIAELEPRRLAGSTLRRRWE